MDLFNSARRLLQALGAAPPSSAPEPAATASSSAVAEQRRHEQRALERIDACGFNPAGRVDLMRDEVLLFMQGVFADCLGVDKVHAPLLRFPGVVHLMFEVVSASADRAEHALKSRAEVLRLECRDLVLYHRLHYSSDLVCLAEIDGSSERVRMPEFSICQFESGAELVEIDDGSLVKCIVGPSSANFPGARYPWRLVYRTCEEGALRVLTIDNEESEVIAYPPKAES